MSVPADESRGMCRISLTVHCAVATERDTFCSDRKVFRYDCGGKRQHGFYKFWWQ